MYIHISRVHTMYNVRMYASICGAHVHTVQYNVHCTLYVHDLCVCMIHTHKSCTYNVQCTYVLYASICVQEVRIYVHCSTRYYHTDYCTCY